MSDRATRIDPTRRPVVVDGLALATSIELPRARAAPAARERRRWRVEARRKLASARAGPTEWLDNINRRGEVCGSYGRIHGGTHVRLDGVGDLRVWPRKQRATIDLTHGEADELSALSRFLPYLAALQGRLVLRASCVTFPAGAVAFCSEPGIGKSTLALALDAIGRPFLSDDHLVLEVIDGRFVAHPSLAFLEVGRDESTEFRPDAFVFEGKERVRPCTPAPQAPIPVARVAFLQRGPRLEVRRLDPDEGKARLRRSIISLPDLDQASTSAGQSPAEIIADSRVPMLELTVPDDLKALSEELERLQVLLLHT